MCCFQFTRRYLSAVFSIHVYLSAVFLKQLLDFYYWTGICVIVQHVSPLRVVCVYGGHRENKRLP